MITEHVPLVSAIVVNWNGGEMLCEALTSLFAQTWPALEVILVDNGSTDRSVDMAVSRFGDSLSVVRNGKNLGFAAGNNAGLELARGEFVALLNNDTKAEPGWLAALYECIRSDQRIAACDSKVLYYDRPEMVWSSGGSYTVAGSVFARRHRERTGQR